MCTSLGLLLELFTQQKGEAERRWGACIYICFDFYRRTFILQDLPVNIWPWYFVAADDRRSGIERACTWGAAWKPREREMRCNGRGREHSCNTYWCTTPVKNGTPHYYYGTKKSRLWQNFLDGAGSTGCAVIRLKSVERNIYNKKKNMWEYF